MDATLHLTKRRDCGTRSETQFLESLDLGAASFLQQGRPDKAMDYLEEAFHQRQHRLGQDSPEALAYAQSMARKILPVACSLLEKGEGVEATQLLHRVETVLPVSLSSELCDLMCALSCAYRKQRKQTLARQYALRALEVLDSRPTVPVDRTNAYLTMCAALSTSGEHTEALSFALRAIQSAQEELVEFSLNKSQETSRKMPILAVAYHNAGVEAEYIVQYDIAMEWYQKALRFVRQHREDCPKLKDLEKTYQAAVFSLDKKRNEAAPFVSVQKNATSRPPGIPKFRSPTRTNTAAISDRSGVRRKGNRPATAIHRLLSPKLPSERTPKTSHIRLAFSRQASPTFTHNLHPSSTETSLERHPVPSSPRNIAQVHTEGDLDAHELANTELSDFSLETSPRDFTVLRPPLRFKATPRTGKYTPNADHFINADLEAFKAQEVSLKAKTREGSLSRKNSGSGNEENAPSSPTSSFPSSLQVSFRAPGLAEKQESEEEQESADLLEQLRTVVVIPRQKKSNPQQIEDRKAEEVRNYEEKHKAAVRIQAKIRQMLGKLRVKTLKNAENRHKMRLLRLRTVKKFPQGLGIIHIYQQPCKSSLFLSVSGPFLPLNLPFLPIPEGMDVNFAAKQLIYEGKRFQISVKSELNSAFPAVIKIQSLWRGAIARKRALLLRSVQRKGRKTVHRSCQQLNGRFLTLFLVRNGTYLAVVQNCEELAKPIPESLQSLPPAELLEQIRLRGDSLDFPEDKSKTEIGLSLPFPGFGTTGKRKSPRPIMTELPPPCENPASPSSVPSQSSGFSPSPNSSYFEETLKQMEKPVIEFVSETGSDYLPAQGNEQGSDSTESVDKAAVETEALGSFIAFEREEIVAKEEIATNNGLFLVSIYRAESGLIELSAEPIQSSILPPEKTAYDEAVLRAEFQYTSEEPLNAQVPLLLSDFAVMDNKAVFTRLYSALQEANLEDFSVPRIVICESSTPVLAGRSQNRKEWVSPLQRNSAAICIQCAWRRYMAKSHFSLLKAVVKSSKASKVFSCYRLFLGNTAFSVQMYERKEGVTISAVNIVNQHEYALDLHQGKDYQSLNYEQISTRMWTKGTSLGVFLLENMTNRHIQAATSIAKAAKGWITRKAVLRVKTTTMRQMQACRVKEFDGIRLGLSAFLQGSKLQIECFRLFKTGNSKSKSRFAIFSLRELASLYPSPLSPLFVLDDVGFEGEQLILRSRVSKLQTRQQTLLSSKTVKDTRSIIRTSRRLDEKMWVVTMGIIGASEDLLRPSEDDIVEFAAFATSQQKPLTVKTTVEELANLTKMSPGDIFPMGTLAIQRLLKVKDGALIIDPTEKVPEINTLATYIQAHVLGFITRRKMQRIKTTKSTLITCMIVSLEGAQWVMYAYREPPFIKMEAVHRIHKTVLSTLVSDNIFSKFPPTLSKKRIIDNFIIPKLHIVSEDGTRHLRATKSMQLQQSLFEKHQGKIKVLTQNVGAVPVDEKKTAVTGTGLRARKGLGPLAALMLKPGVGESPPKATSDISPKRPSKKIAENESDDSSSESLSPVPQLTVPAGEYRDSPSLILSFIGDDPQKAPKFPEEEKKSPEPLALFTGRKEARKETRTEPLQAKFAQKVNRPLLLRSGFEQEGRHYIVSMSGDRKAVLVEFQDQQSNEKVSKEVNISAEIVDNLELYCTQLLNKVTLTRASNGHLTISLNDQKSQVLSVLYKKSHYVSNRYCIVTINETSAGILVSCYDPERQQTLEMPLGPRKQRSPDLLQKDLADLVKRLRIGEVLGEATLSLALG